MGNSSSISSVQPERRRPPKLCFFACSESYFSLWCAQGLLAWQYIESDQDFLEIARRYCIEHLMDAESQSRLARHLPWPYEDAMLMRRLLQDAEQFKPLLCYSCIKAVHIKRACDVPIYNDDLFAIMQNIDAIEPLPENRVLCLDSIRCDTSTLPSDQDARYEIVQIKGNCKMLGSQDAMVIKDPVTKRWKHANNGSQSRFRTHSPQSSST